ncbi:DoxX family protein [Flavisphingopyxis soli]|uniref:DoxX family protein n=1 Tax=Flavisphingopyxis soli TaxID=2601267 RepID=UPI00191C3D1D|nr:DoxX family protein [Sphingorhabdus soli]
MAALGTLFAFIGRIGLSLIFILSGVGKLMNPEATNSYIASNPYLSSMGFLPMAWGIGLFELVAGVFILIGFMTRLTSLLLAGFTILAALFFHNDFGDPMQQANFLKNIAIAGGFLVLFAYGNTRSSLDSYRAARKDQADRTVVHERVVHDEALGNDPVVVTDRTTTRHD